jgi:hypothetical protein
MTGLVRNLEADRALLIMAVRQAPKMKMRQLVVLLLLKNGSGRARRHSGVVVTDENLGSTSSKDRRAGEHMMVYAVDGGLNLDFDYVLVCLRPALTSCDGSLVHDNLPILTAQLGESPAATVPTRAEHVASA